MKISEIDELFEKCWKGYEKKGMKTMFGKRVPNCVKKESVELSEGKTVAVKFYDEFDSANIVHIGDNTLSLNNAEVNKNFQWDRPKGHAFSTAESYVSDWMYKTAKNWNEVHAWLKRVRDTGNEKALLAAVQKAFDTGSMAPKIVEGQELEEDLRAWFGKGKKGGAGGGGWDRYNTKGERIGKCGDSKEGEGKPKCLSKSRAASLRSSGGKKAIANAVKRKKANDPNPNRKGKAKNVNSHPKK